MSCTTTLNNSYGSAVTVTGAGFLLNDEMDDFATSPGQAEHVRPGAGRGQRHRAGQADAVRDDAEHRARSDAGSCYWSSGTPGGPRIITMVYHVISNVIDHRMTLAEAMGAPRMHHQALPDSLRVEDGGFLPESLDSLRARGHGDYEQGPLGRRGGDHPDAERMAGCERSEKGRRRGRVLKGGVSLKARKVKGTL